MIVMDMDDTLLNDQLEISKENESAIRKARNAGITIVLASGRPTPAMQSFAYDLDFHSGGYLISYNGAYVDDLATGETMFEVCLTQYEAKLLVQTARAQNVGLHTYIDGEIVTDNINAHTNYEAELTGMPIRVVLDLAKEIQSSVPKLLMVGEPDRIKTLKTTLSKSMSGRFMISISKPVFLEFTNQEVDKSRGIDVICQKLGIAKSDVMAIGDSYNDLTMIRDCGVGVAMGNAPEDIKVVADVTTASCLENGVAKIIEQVLESQSENIPD